ncbi:MAG: type II toxin-antitoxin system RelE/ParE family toxin [Verrucomicrobia bacterium]|nr:type II toxin-antitoxin system RelE/ParE family toxin [Verrucomicrobiota bacterium]
MSGYFLTRQAHCDLEATEDFLLPRNPDAAHRFLVRAVEVFELLAKNPELGRRRSDIRVETKTGPGRSLPRDRQHPSSLSGQMSMGFPTEQAPRQCRSPRRCR